MSIKTTWGKLKDFFLDKKGPFYWIKIGLFMIWIVFTIVAVKKIFFTNNDNSYADMGLKPVSTYTDKNGAVHSEIKVLELSNSELKKATDSLQKLLKGRTHINTVTKFVSVIDTVFRDLPVSSDSITGDFSLEKRDNHIQVYIEGNSRLKTARIALSGQDTLTYIDYTRKKFLKSNERVINLFHTNPYITITEGSSITLKQKKDLVVVTAGGYYDPINKRSGIAIGAGIKIFSIKTK